MLLLGAFLSVFYNRSLRTREEKGGKIKRRERKAGGREQERERKSLGKREKGGGGIGKGKKQDDLVFMHFFFEAMRRMQFYVEISFFIFSLGMYEGMNVVIIS